MHVVQPLSRLVFGSGVSWVGSMCRGGFAPPASGGDEAAKVAVRNYFYGAQCGGPEASATGYYLDGTPRNHGELLTASAGASVVREALGAEQFSAMFDHCDPRTGEKLRAARGAAVPFMEKGMNVDKSLALVADYDDEVGAALDAALGRAASAWMEYAQQNFVTRVGPRGAVEFKQAEQIRAAVFAHEASRSGEAHAHLHVLFSTDVYAEGKYRALFTKDLGKNHSAGLNALAEAVIYSDPQLRGTLAKQGYHFDPATGEVAELYAKTAEGKTYVEALSTRHAQIETNKALLEENWRADPAHAGKEPGPALRLDWDTMAWRGTAKLEHIEQKLIRRPKKQSIHSGVDAKQRRRSDLEALGFIAPDAPVAVETGKFPDTSTVALNALGVLERNRSAWSVNDIRAEATRQMVAAGVMADRDQITAHVENAVAMAVAECASTTDPRKVTEPGRVPAHIRHWTTQNIIQAEDRLKLFMAERAEVGTDADASVVAARVDADYGFLNDDQREAVEALAGDHQFIVIEGAAGSGKSTMLAAADQARGQERALMMLAPTRTAAQVLEAEDLQADTVHKFLHAHGLRWDDHGRYQRLSPGAIDPQTGNAYQGVPQQYRLAPGSMIAVDEAGMLSQTDVDMLAGVLSEHYPDAQLAFIGDRAQLPAVGRGGVLDMAVKEVRPRHVDLEKVNRFKHRGGGIDHEAAEISQDMRQRENLTGVYEQKQGRGEIIECATEEQAHAHMAVDTAKKIRQGVSTSRVVATNEMRIKTSHRIRDELVATGYLRDSSGDVQDRDGLSMPVGTRVAARKNDWELGVANRQQFTVTGTSDDGDLLVVGDDHRHRRLPAEYVTEHVETAWAVTAHGAQGITVDDGAVLADNSIDGGGLYVGATRGRYNNTIYLVASEDETGAEQFTRLMHADRADRGLDAARATAERELEDLAPITTPTPEPEVEVGLHPVLLDYLNDLEEGAHRAEHVADELDAVSEYQQRCDAFAQKYGYTLEQAWREASRAQQRADQAQQAHQQTRKATGDEIYRDTHERAAQQMNTLRSLETTAKEAGLFTRGKKKDAAESARTEIERSYNAPVPHSEARLKGDYRDEDQQWVHDVAADHTHHIVDQAPEVEAAAHTMHTENHQAQQVRQWFENLKDPWEKEVGAHVKHPGYTDQNTGKLLTPEAAREHARRSYEAIAYFSRPENQDQFLQNPPAGYDPHQTAIEAEEPPAYDPHTDPNSAEYQQRKMTETLQQNQQTHGPGFS